MAFTFPFYLEVLPGVVEPWKCQPIVVAVTLWHGWVALTFILRALSPDYVVKKINLDLEGVDTCSAPLNYRKSSFLEDIIGHPSKISGGT